MRPGERYWRKGDREPKFFDEAVVPVGDHQYTAVPMDRIPIGQPAFLRLPGGAIIATSKVLSVEEYRIRTESRTYLKNLAGSGSGA